MTQVTLHTSLSENISQLYDEYATIPLWYGGIKSYYGYFNSLHFSDIKVLDLPASIHRSIINIDTIKEASDADEYLERLRKFDTCISFELFYLVVYTLLYIQIFDSEYMELYNKLYALALACFNYNMFRERVL